MKELRFINGPVPKGFKFDFESCLFNEERYRRLQSATGWQTYSLINEKSRLVLAAIHFHITKDVATSPLSAPFGSADFSSSISPADLFAFLASVESALKKRGVKKIFIKNPPARYNPDGVAMLEVFMLNRGYHISEAALSTMIDLADEAYETKLDTWELRKLKQSKKANLQFRTLPDSAIEQIYSFIAACRTERQQALSMSLQALKKTTRTLPGRFVLFAVYKGDELAAASISIRVSSEIVYNFYSAHPRQFDSISPVVFLMKGMYEWCRQEKVEGLDLGTSSLDGQPNFGLLDFKLRLSGIPTTKFSFEKKL